MAQLELWKLLEDGIGQLRSDLQKASEEVDGVLFSQDYQQHSQERLSFSLSQPEATVTYSVMDDRPSAMRQRAS